MFALLISLSLTNTAEAAGPTFCSSVSWSDLVAYAPGDFLEGGVPALGLGGKGDIDSNDEITFDAYQSGVGYLGSAEVDASGSVTLSGDVTAFEPIAFGWDCNTPSTLRYFIKTQVDGTTFYVLIYP